MCCGVRESDQSPVVRSTYTSKRKAATELRSTVMLEKTIGGPLN